MKATEQKIETLTKNEKLAIKYARKVRQRAVSPISIFKVGAVAITKNGNFFPGINMEEAALNGTIHAEPSAISGANANGDGNVVTIVVCGDIPNQPNLYLWTCLHCWQFICNQAELLEHPIKIISVHSKGDGFQVTTTNDPPPKPLSFRDIGIDPSKYRRK